MKTNSPIKFALALVGLVALALAGCSARHSGVVRVAGQIESRDADAGSRVGGRVVAVHAEEGDTVKTGDLLVELDALEAKAALAAAEAAAAARDAELSKLVHGATEEQLAQARAAAEAADAQLAMALKGARTEEIRAAGAALEAAEARRVAARKEYKRIQDLNAQGVASQQQLDGAKADLDTSEAMWREAREHRDLAVAGSREEEIAIAQANDARARAALAEMERGAREEDIAAATAVRDGALAEVARAKTVLSEMSITSPQNGVVESLDVRPGDLVKAGAIAHIVDPEDIEVMFYVGAALLGGLQLQQEVIFTADAFGKETFTGHIIRIATEGEFTPRNLQTEEERVQQVFGVKVAFDSAGGRLRPGMSVTAQFPAANGSG